MSFNTGDIILYNDVNYLILDKDEELLCLPLKYKKIDGMLQYIDFNDVTFNDIKKISEKEKLKYVTRATDNLLLYTLKRYKDFINVLNQNNNPSIGCIIFKENKYYCIFSEEGNKWLVFELNKNVIKNGDSFLLGDSKYYTNYFQTSINKNDIFKIIYKCRERQIELLKIKRSIYLKKSYDNIKEAGTTVVKLDQESDEEYIVKSSIGNKLICVSNYDKNPKYNKRHYINEEDVIFVKIKQKRK